MNYADAFKSLRHAYGLTQIEFAGLLRVSKPTIQKLEAGDYQPSEKITVRLAELFRSEKFRNEFRSRVETGDLRSVGAVFSELLGLVDAEESVDLPTSKIKSKTAQLVNLADVYADLKKDYAEFRTIVENLSESNRNYSETAKCLAVSTQNLSESGKNLVETTKILSESNKNLSESVKSLAEGRVVR